MSYDEGKTWQAGAAGARSRDKWLRERCCTRRDAKSVSLKATDERMRGGSVDQTIIRAYDLK